MSLFLISFSLRHVSIRIGLAIVPEPCHWEQRWPLALGIDRRSSGFGRSCALPCSSWEREVLLVVCVPVLSRPCLFKSVGAEWVRCSCIVDNVGDGFLC